MKTYTEWLLENILSDEEYSDVVNKFKSVWDKFDSARSKYRNGEISRSEFLYLKNKFEDVQKQYSGLVT